MAGGHRPPLQSDQLSNSIFRHSREDLSAIRLASQERLREFLRLPHGHLRGHRRFVGIDNGFDQYRSRRVQRLLDDAAAIFRSIDRDSGSTAGLRDESEIDGMQFASIFGVSEEYHL